METLRSCTPETLLSTLDDAYKKFKVSMIKENNHYIFGDGSLFEEKNLFFSLFTYRVAEC